MIREAFEEWAKQNGYDLEKEKETDEYHYTHTLFASKGWQAAEQ